MIITASKSLTRNISFFNTTANTNQNITVHQFNQTVMIFLDLATRLQPIGYFNISGFDRNDTHSPILLSSSLTKIGVKLTRFNSSLLLQNLTSTILLYHVDYTLMRMNLITA